MKIFISFDKNPKALYFKEGSSVSIVLFTKSFHHKGFSMRHDDLDALVCHFFGFCGTLLIMTSVAFGWPFSSLPSHLGSNLSEPPPSPALVATSSTKLLSNEEIGERVEKRYRNAPFLTVTTRIWQFPLDGVVDPANPISGGLEPITVAFQTTRDAFRTLVFDKQGKRIAAISLLNGQIQENMPSQPVREYETEYPNGITKTINRLEESCLIGGNIFSWVGVPEENNLPRNLDVAQVLRETIELGERQPDAIENGHDCYVTRQEIQIDVDDFHDTVVLTNYIDKATFFVVRRIMIQSGVQRERTSEITESAEVPSDINWRSVEWMDGSVLSKTDSAKVEPVVEVGPAPTEGSVTGPSPK